MLLRAIYRKYLSFNMLYQRFEGIILNLHFLQHSFSIEGYNFEDFKYIFYTNEDQFYCKFNVRKQCNLFMLIP